MAIYGIREEMQELKAWWENDEHIGVAKEIQREHFTNPGSLWPNTVIINSDARRQTLDLLAPLCRACEGVEDEIERGVRKRATPGQAAMDLQGIVASAHSSKYAVLIRKLYM